MSPDATTGGENSAPVLTSEKLDALKAQYAELWQKMLTMTDPFSKETKDAKLAVWKIESEIKAEEAALQKAANDAKIAELRNQRLQLNTNQLNALRALIAIENDKKATPEAKQAAIDEFNTAKELVDNELLAKFAASSAAKKSVPASDGEPSSGKDSANKDAILEMYLAGKTQAEIQAAGFARSTVWHTINNYKKANQPA